MFDRLCNEDVKYINLPTIKRTIKKRYKMLLAMTLFAWILVGTVYMMVGKEYEASYYIEYKSNQEERKNELVMLEFAKTILESYDVKTQTLNKAGVTTDIDWHMNRISVINIKNTDIFKVTIRGKSQKEVTTVAEHLLDAQKQAVNKINQENIESLRVLTNYVEIMKTKVRDASEEEKALAMIEYTAAQSAFQLEYMKALKGSYKIVEIGGIVHSEKAAFPTTTFFVGAACALSFIGAALMIITFSYQDKI